MSSIEYLGHRSWLYAVLGEVGEHASFFVSIVFLVTMMLSAATSPHQNGMKATLWFKTRAGLESVLHTTPRVAEGWSRAPEHPASSCSLSAESLLLESLEVVIATSSSYTHHTIYCSQFTSSQSTRVLATETFPRLRIQVWIPKTCLNQIRKVNAE